MKLKHKVRIGFGLILITNILAGSLSIFYIDRLSEGAKVVLKNNYETLSFARDMRTVLDDHDLPFNDAAKAAFDKSLAKQEHNVTEKGEDAATLTLRRDFNSLINPAASSSQQQNTAHVIRGDLRTIEELNMKAIVSKTDAAQKSVNNATIVLGIIGCLTFLALFSFTVNISGYISEPLISLSDGMEEIGRKNYDHRLNFTRSNEFTAVSDAFNEMAKYLKKNDLESLNEVLAQKQRIETVIELMHDAVIILNEKQEILNINIEAQNLLNLQAHRMAGKPAQKLAADNALFKSILETEDDRSSLKIKHNGKECIFQLENVKIFIPNVTTIKPDEVNIARLPAGKIFILRNQAQYQAI